MRIKQSLSVLFVVSCMSQPATAEDSICPALLKWGIYDQANIMQTSDKFSLVKTVVCGSEQITYKAAKDAKTNLNIGIIDVFDGAFGSATNESNFSERKQKFCAKNLAIESANETDISNVKQISGTLTNAFVQCVQSEASKQPGVKAYIQTLPIYEAFTIEILYTPNPANPIPYHIRSISSAPPLAACDFPKDEPINTNTYTISCQKPADKSVMMSMVTDHGSMKGTLVPRSPGFEESIKNELDRLDKRINSVQTQSAALQSGLSTTQQTTAKLASDKADKSAMAQWGPGSEAPAANFGGNIGESGVAWCPQGQYAAGVSVIDSDGGRYCVSCISGVRLHCKPIGQ